MYNSVNKCLWRRFSSFLLLETDIFRKEYVQNEIWFENKQKKIIPTPKKISSQFLTNLNLVKSQHIRFNFVAQI